ncbi:MAG TPA: UDP-2,3-diacylglucosamine diphosphatase [Geobacterales bacterium]|nr:UDP-2,3-diacylglucosamine diphosphatase [Geobacterales bacterium]
MSAIFIADAHLRRPSDENYRRLLQFLDSLRGGNHTLYILGDLFEFWIGFDRPPSADYEPVIERLAALRQEGTPIIYLEGNHDFFLHRFFGKHLGCTIHPGPLEISLNGQRTLLCHGDQANGKDLGYRLLRATLRSTVIRLLTKFAPLSLVCWVARTMNAGSKGQHANRRGRVDYGAIVRSYAAEQFARGLDIVIAGHFHTPILEESAVDGRRCLLLSLGDWITHFTYGEWRDNELLLRTFAPPEEQPQAPPL